MFAVYRDLMIIKINRPCFVYSRILVDHDRWQVDVVQAVIPLKDLVVELLISPWMHDKLHRQHNRQNTTENPPFARTNLNSGAAQNKRILK